MIGIEQVEDAVADARANAEKNGTVNCTFVAGQVEKLIATSVGENGKFDIVVADPPREGIHKSVLRALIEMRPSVLHIRLLQPHIPGRGRKGSL